MVNAHTAMVVGRDAVAQQVESLINRLHPTVTFERRSTERLAIPVLFRLVPLNERGEPNERAAITVVGKNISSRGLSFYHEHPIPYRRALVSAQVADGERFAAEIDISWCRFTKPGWYESGGRLVTIVPAE